VIDYVFYAGLHSGAVGGRGQSTRYAQPTVISNAVTVVVASVADFAAGHAPGADTVVCDAIAVIIQTVTGFSDRAVYRSAAFLLAFINAGHTVVILVVADVTGIVAKPGRRNLRLRRTGAGQQVDIAVGRGSRDRK
jgi:hypothetical protein